MSLILPQRGRLSTAAAGAPDLVGAYQTASIDTADRNLYTFSSLSIGSAPTGSDRRFVICSYQGLFKAGSGAVFTTFTIGGVSASYAIDIRYSTSGFETLYVGIGYAELNSGTTATVVIDPPGSTQMYGMGVALHTIVTGADGLFVGTPSTQQVLNSVVTAQSVTAGEGSYSIGVLGSQNSTGVSSGTTNMTYRYYGDTNTSEQFAGADEAGSGTHTFGPTYTPGGAKSAIGLVEFKKEA